MFFSNGKNLKVVDKILVINDFYFGGGAEGVFRDTYELLRKEGNAVDLFYGEKKSTEPTSVFSYLYNFKAKLNLEKKLESFSPTVIHIHNYYHFLSPSIFTAIKKFKKKNNVKVIFTAHDYHLICPSSGMLMFKNNEVFPISSEMNTFSSLFFKCIDHRGWKYSWIKKIYWIWSIKLHGIVHQIDQIISPSEFLAQLFIENAIKTPVVVVRNPLRRRLPEDVLRNKTPCSEEIRLLFMGRLSQEKGLQIFLEAFAKLSSKASIKIDILGTGIEEKKLKHLVFQNKIENVTFHGFKTGDELDRFLINSNVLLLPSVCYENAPLSIIEGAAFGNIVLVKKLGGMIELSKKSKQYVLVDNWELELENTLKKLRGSPKNELFDISEFSDSNYINNIQKCYSK